jgi:hypothetical protein
MHTRHNPESLPLERLSDFQQARQAEMRMYARLQRELGPIQPYGKQARAQFLRKVGVAAAVGVLIALAIAQVVGAAVAASGGGGGGGAMAVM